MIHYIELLCNVTMLKYICPFLGSFFLTIFSCKVLSYLYNKPRFWRLPIFGHLLYIGKNPHKKLTEWSRFYGTVYKLQLGTWPTVVINGYKAVKHALLKHKDDFAGRPKFDSFKHYAEGRSISFRDYDKEFREERNIARSIIQELIRDPDFQMDDVIHAAGQDLIKALINGSEIDPSISVHTAVGTILYSLCFGKSNKLCDDEEFLKMLTSSNPNTDLLGAGRQQDLLPPCLRNKQYSVGLRYMKHQVHLNDRKIKQCMKQIQSGDMESSFVAKALCYENHKGLIHTTIELLSAGSETSSAILLWLIMYMALHQDYQEKLYEEIQNSNCEFDSLPHMQACITEVMRLNTTVPLALPHSAIRDVNLSGQSIKRNTYVIVNLWSVCRDPSLWENPDSFKPERFLKLKQGDITFDNVKAEKIFAFGAGSRRCIGETLGKKQVFQLFVQLIKACKIKKGCSELDFEPHFGDVLRPKAFKVIFQSRKTLL